MSQFLKEFFGSKRNHVFVAGVILQLAQAKFGEEFPLTQEQIIVLLGFASVWITGDSVRATMPKTKE